ncbi:hypothetical protein NX059_005994 [Plenodomus lindquistii]|nr:hypothetical protein NX059_005994 [Plenodomus lindquistii]
MYAQAYLGGLGIAKALEKGADIHEWKRSDLDRLANAFVADYLSECSSYATGGNYTGFKDLESSDWTNIGYPIVEISHSGAVIVTKNKGSGGEFSVSTLTLQFLHEIQGPWYYNSDATAILDSSSHEQLELNRVTLHGVKGALRPPTTKVGITAKPLYQPEMHWFLVGLDIPAKARMTEQQIRYQMRSHIHNFTRLEFQTIG